jgi:hypothetical protein
MEKLLVPKNCLDSKMDWMKKLFKQKKFLDSKMD